MTVLRLAKAGDPRLSWDAQSGPGPGPLVYEVVGGVLEDLRSSGLGAASDCIAGDLSVPVFDDTRPGAGEGAYYLVRARNACGGGSFGRGREELEPLDCRGR